MRMIAKFAKTGPARYVSQLDLLRAVQRAIRRSGLPVKYSSGFNPHQVIAFASAASVGLASEAEWMDVALCSDVSETVFFDALAPQMPPGLTLMEAHAVEDRYPALMSITAYADYLFTLSLSLPIAETDARDRLESLLAAPILAVKKGKAGPKEVDLRAFIASLDVASCIGDAVEVRGRLVHAPSGALNPELLLPKLTECLDADPARHHEILRTAFWIQNGEERAPLWCANPTTCRN